MRKIKDLPVHERPREKLLSKGAKALSDHELLAVILGGGSKKNNVFSLSKKVVKLIDENGSNIEAKDIIGIDGIGEAKATSISAAFEFMRRRIKPEGLKIKSPTDVLPLLQHYRDRKQEHFLCISLNGANEVMNVRVITIGLVNQTQIHPREVFADVIAERASAIIIAHNHPSGNLIPSKEDVRITQRMRESSAILGIKLLDHVIFGTKGYFSFNENKLF